MIGSVSLALTVTQGLFKSLTCGGVSTVEPLP